MNKKALLIIDPLVSTNYLLGGFKEKGFSIVTLFTFLSPEEVKIELPKGLSDVVIFSQHDLSRDIKAIKDQTKEYHLVAGFYGDEASIDYSDQILHAFFPGIANNPKTSLYRYDKYVGNEIMRANNMPYIRQESIAGKLDKQDKISIASRFYQQYKNIVIKPSNQSGASLGVYSPQSIKEIATYFDHNDHFYYNRPGDYVVQEKMTGSEYFVDVASYDGEHFVTSIGQHHKKLINGQFQHMYFNIFNVLSAELELIKDYAIQVLNALEMRTGLSHLEIMLAENHHCYLIELNPRISGINGMVNYAAKKMNGFDQITAFDALVKKSPMAYTHDKQYCMGYTLKSFKRKYNQIDTKLIMNKARSFHKLEVIRPSQLDVQKEQNLLDIVGIIILLSKDREAIAADTKILQQLESDGDVLSYI